MCAALLRAPGLRLLWQFQYFFEAIIDLSHGGVGQVTDGLIDNCRVGSKEIGAGCE
jgi:hypothetical protein